MVQPEFRILGPLEAGFAGRPVRLGGLRRRTLLAALLLDAGQPVPVGRLARAVWDDRPPASVRTQIAIHVAAVRKAVRSVGCDAEVIVTEPSGYRLGAEAVRLDLHEAERWIAEGRALAAAGRTERAAATLGRALALWRGPVLAGLDSPAIAASARRLEEVRLAVAEEWAALELECGRPRAVVGRLTGLVDDHPLCEGLREKLMLALSHAGRQADALACYRRGREVLVGELGLEPGRGLRQAHRVVLHGSSGRFPIRPAQLPPPVRGFVGRAPELRALDRLLAQDGPRVAVVSGVAGAGKTALVLRWAHQMAGRFPDGQLFAELRGHDPEAEPARPHEVLERFLRALGAAGLTGRQTLMVLDGAASAEQVRPLLADAPGCRVIVTSRRRLDVAALAVPVDALPVPECVDLLGRVAGTRRVSAEGAAAERLARLCGGLPLAVRIAAAKLARQPRWPLSGLVERLADERGRLDELVCDGLSVRDSIATSYRELPPGAARLFDRLGLVEASADIGPRLAAGLLGTSHERAAGLLSQLGHAQLLRPPGGPSRPYYRFHELVRLFARERAGHRSAAR